MQSFLLTLVSLYLPLLLGISAFVFALKVNIHSKSTVLTVQPFGFFGMSFPISNRRLTRLLLSLFGFGCFSLYAFYDYSTFFPQHLQMDVFFDEAGLANVMAETLDSRDIRTLGIPQDYPKFRGHYFNVLDSEVKNVLRAQFFSLTPGAVHSSGETSFIVKKLDVWQRYHIEESKGELVHTLEAAHTPTRQFYTLFEKLPSPDDYIQASIRDLFVRRSVMIRPRFKQLLAENRTSQGVTFNVAVVGVTKLTMFPSAQLLTHNILRRGR